MSEKFKGSIAQENVQFPIETVVTPIAGEAYSKAVIYMPLSKASAYLPGVSQVTAGMVEEIKSTNYSSVTGGLLGTWLVPFFKSAQTAVVYVAVYDDGESETQTFDVIYEATKFKGYFKFAIEEDEKYNTVNVKLGQLCNAEPLYSAHWVGLWDSEVLNSSSPMISSLKAGNCNSRVVYNPDKAINAALAQLGKSLSSVNATGTPVGNSIDMVAFNTVKASGTADADGNRDNLTPRQKGVLDGQKVGYNTWVGDGTDNVTTEGSLTLTGESVGAMWVKAYIEYVCKVNGANYMTRMNRFRDNSTYQAILTILRSVVNGFVAMGRLADFKITAPVFANLPKTGDTLTIPNAWSATYTDNVREIQVYGTLYITQPTR